MLILLFSSTATVQPQKVTDAEVRQLNDSMLKSYTAGDFEKAYKAADRLVQMATQQFGKNSLATARALKNRGVIQNAKGDAEGAEKSFENAVSIYRNHENSLSKTDGSAFAELLENLGRVRARKGTLWAEGIFKEALEWREKSNGPEAIETATPLANLGDIYFWKREYKKSAELFARSLANLAKSTKAPKEDITLVYYRTRCSYRKAKLDEDFVALTSLYGDAAEFSATVPRTARLINAGVVNGKALYLAKPIYPDAARDARSEGTIQVDVLINETGSVISACAVETKQDVALIEVSERAAYKSRFSPTTLDGRPIKVSGRIVYSFKRY
ncbi:MAG: tetratricopeptide repeat protein [Acidobacteriota bacterium]